MVIPHQSLQHPGSRYKALETGIKGSSFFVFVPNEPGVRHTTYPCFSCAKCQHQKPLECESASKSSYKHDNFFLKEVSAKLGKFKEDTKEIGRFLAFQNWPPFDKRPKAAITCTAVRAYLLEKGVDVPVNSKGKKILKVTRENILELWNKHRPRV